MIAGLNPAYLQRIDRHNIVGYDRPWRDPSPTVDFAVHERMSCVLKADVQAFSALMRAGADAPVQGAGRRRAAMGAGQRHYRDGPW